MVIQAYRFFLQVALFLEIYQFHFQVRKTKPFEFISIIESFQTKFYMRGQNELQCKI